jgi:hypothetical protein
MSDMFLGKRLYFPMCLHLQFVERRNAWDDLVDEKDLSLVTQHKLKLTCIGGAQRYRYLAPSQRPHCCRSSINVDGSC